MDFSPGKRVLRGRMGQQLKFALCPLGNFAEMVQWVVVCLKNAYAACVPVIPYLLTTFPFI